MTAPYPSQQFRPILILPPSVAGCLWIGMSGFEYSWLWSMINTEGASSTSSSREIELRAEMEDLLPSLQPLPNVIFRLDSSMLGTMFSQTLDPRYTSSPM